AEFRTDTSARANDSSSTKSADTGHSRRLRSQILALAQAALQTRSDHKPYAAMPSNVSSAQKTDFAKFSQQSERLRIIVSNIPV
ncbi:hypothetical protein, partial [Epibacterium ulvae]|uniref:hypothetical protein n=1 Tax=Epibacterium ulvae TaxID=1156985 RepID=UPI002491D20B